MHEQTTAPSPIEQPAGISAAPSRRRRRRLMVGLFAGLIVVPTAAAATVGGVHSGFFGASPPEGSSPMNVVGEEFLRTWDPEVRGVVQDLTTEIALPAGASYGPLLKRFPLTTSNGMGKQLIQRTDLAQLVASYAQCKWYQDWLNGDATQRAADQPTIDAMTTSKVWRMVNDDWSGGQTLDLAKAIAAETRVGTTTRITGHIEGNCLGKTENMGGGPSPEEPHKAAADAKAKAKAIRQHRVSGKDAK